MTKGWIDLVIRMRVDAEEAKQFCLMNLRDQRRQNKVTKEEFTELKRYILNHESKENLIKEQQMIMER